MANHWMRLSLISIACGVLMTPSAQVSAMGLMQAYDAALQNDPNYRSAISDSQAGKEYKAIGLSGLLPSLQYSYATSKNKAETTAPNFLGTETTSNTDYRSITNNVSLRQTLFNLDALARYKQGIAQTSYSDAQFVSRSMDLTIRLVSAYVEVKYAEDQLSLIVAQRDSLSEQKRVNDRMFEKGEGTKTDMLETQARLDVAEAQVIEYTDNLMNTRNVLAGMTGTDVTNLDGLNNDFRAMSLVSNDFEEWKLVAEKNNAELAAGRFNVEIAEQEVSKSKAGHAPRLDLNAGYNHGISDSLTTQKQDSAVRSIGIQLIIPLYSGGYVHAVSKQAIANREKAKSDLDATTNKVMSELRKQFSALNSSIAKVAALRKSVESATLLVDATKQSVKGGVRINLDVLNAQQQLISSKRDFALARYTYLTSFLKLRVAAGNLNIDDLQAVAGYFSAAN
jgi:outer membrane protein, protease secretion system